MATSPTTRLSLSALTAGHRPALGLATGCAILASCLELAPAVFIAAILQALLNDLPPRALWLAAGLAGVTLLATALQWLASQLSHLVAIDVQAELRHRIGRQLLAAPLGQLNDLEPGALRQAMLDDVERLEDGIAHLVPDLAAAIVAPLAVLVVLLFVDWRLALATLAPVLFGSIAFASILRRDQGASARFGTAQAEMASALQEAVELVPEIKAYNVRASGLRRQETAFTDFLSAVRGWLDFGTRASNAFFLATTSTLLIVLPTGLWAMASGTLSLPLLVFVLLAAIGLTSIGARLFGAMGRLRLQSHLLERLSALTSLPELPPGQVTTLAHTDLRVENLTFRYGDGAALSDISLDIPAGSRVALVGPSGAGKSTLARLLLRFQDPDAGRILLGGHDLRQLAPDTLAAQFSAMFQEVHLFSGSIRDNIGLARPEASLAEIEAAARQAHADAFIQALPQGYDTPLPRGGGLSGGQRQRLALARALLKNAPIIVLDEATAYADPDSEFEIQQALTAVLRGKTVIAIAHRLPTIRHFDHIVYLDGGRITEQGTHDELLALGGAYARQWHAAAPHGHACQA